jgi:hypothetical protein
LKISYLSIEYKNQYLPAAWNPQAQLSANPTKKRKKQQNPKS